MSYQLALAMPTRLRTLLAAFTVTLLCWTSIAASAAQANTAAPAPHEVLQNMADAMLSALKSDQTKIKQDPTHLHGLMERILVPNVDFISGSKWVLGKYWRQASRAQKIEFIREFRTLLVRFYSSALSEYLSGDHAVIPDNLLTFHPARQGPEATEVTVRSEVHPPSGKVVPVHYHMHRTSKGWKVYDVTVQGVSMVTTYKTSFATEIRTNGIDGLIQSLKDRNDKLLADARAAKTAQSASN
ncbi:MAG: ABC transporter substrate-binding protein [Pseudomonadota bacterium]|nr:MAG: ABC transporter substrate-binding protein [Pseudomonadota bacterium]